MVAHDRRRDRPPLRQDPQALRLEPRVEVPAHPGRGAVERAGREQDLPDLGLAQRREGGRRAEEN
eukprot:8832187-Heterocapsa_arctica.AAC.1